MNKVNYKIVGLILLGVFILAYGIPFFLKNGDLDVFCLGAQRLISKNVITIRELNHFTYPPFFALIMIPLGVLPYKAANILWYLINWGCLAGCILMIKELIFRTEEFNSTPSLKQKWIAFCGVLISVKYILSVFENQQFDLLVFFFCLSGLYFIFKKNEIWGSALLAAGISIKCTPLLFLLYFIMKRKGKVVLYTTLFAGLFSFLPDILFYNHKFSYFFDWLSKIVFYHPLTAKFAEQGFNGISLAPGTGVNYLNQSLGVLVYRIFSKNAVQCINNITQFDDNIVTLIKFVIFGIITALPLIILRKKIFKKFDQYNFPILMEAASIFILMVLFSPMSSKPHFNTLLFGNTLLMAILMIKNDKVLFWTIVFPIFIFQFASRELLGHHNTDLFYQCGITTISALLTYTGLIFSYKKHFIKTI